MISEAELIEIERRAIALRDVVQDVRCTAVEQSPAKEQELIGDIEKEMDAIADDIARLVGEVRRAVKA